jgi:hypothetical protein
MIDAKLKGEGVELSEPAEPDRTNVVDLMAALKKSLGQEKPGAAPKQKKARAADARKQPGLKLPIIGGKQDEKARIRRQPSLLASGPDPPPLLPSIRRGSAVPAPRGRRRNSRPRRR